MPAPHHFTGRTPFLPAAQRQSTEGTQTYITVDYNKLLQQWQR